MAVQPAVTPNKRGIKSRELVLDAAERVMAEEGFEAATVARVVEVAGIPLSSVYHYYGSKEGILLAVMERGAEQFFEGIPESDRRLGRPVEHLNAVVLGAVAQLERHPNFLRLLVVFAVQPPGGSSGEVDAVVDRVRELALSRLRRQIHIAFADDPDSELTDRLARFALAAFDGAFVAAQADRRVKLGDLLAPLAAALVATRRALAAAAG